jgi:hypothetical protein
MQQAYAWERQSDETAAMYAAARVYFELGPRRTLRAVAEQCTRSRSTIQRWSSRHQWVARARAYDEYRLAQEDAARRRVLAQATQTEARKWAERLAQEREDEWESSRALLEKAREMLASPLEDTKWNWRDAGALIKQAADLVRLAAGGVDLEGGATGETVTVRVEYATDDAEEEREQHDATESERDAE